MVDNLSDKAIGCLRKMLVKMLVWRKFRILTDACNRMIIFFYKNDRSFVENNVIAEVLLTDNKALTLKNKHDSMKVTEG